MIVTAIAQYAIFLSFGITAYIFAVLPVRLKKNFLGEAVIGGVLAILVAIIGSRLYYDPRPFVVGHFTPYFPHTNDNGFPSDHTLLASFLGFMVLRYKKGWGSLLLILALIIGLARVIAGVHHLADIAGAFACTGISILAIALASRYLKKSRFIHTDMLK